MIGWICPSGNIGWTSFGLITGRYEEISLGRQKRLPVSSFVVARSERAGCVAIEPSENLSREAMKPGQATTGWMPPRPSSREPFLMNRPTQARCKAGNSIRLAWRGVPYTNPFLDCCPSPRPDAERRHSSLAGLWDPPLLRARRVFQG